ncbi:MAG TPA: carbonic anhydrase [Nitrospinaceae bacterium]|jgi:carbonic anhydrase|nr:carbonic anhydrase [Nitrospinaceae bacterium]|tara:strand:+ start:188 stop:772 length:585 start_codon:yes stop_codon:yes gene_type:complete
MNPDEVLETLRAGNERYLNGKTHKHDFHADRAELAQSQHPIAAVLSCSDSRVVPQFAFDQGSGKLFVVRVAGNIATSYGIASLEYAVEYLQTPLIYVLGHTSCGAVDAAIKVVKDGAEFPGELPGLVASIARAVHIAETKTEDLFVNAVRENVRLTVTNLSKTSEIIQSRIQSGKLLVVGGIYELASGKVSLVS